MIFLKSLFGWGFGAISLITSSRLCLLVSQFNMKWLFNETIYHTLLQLKYISVYLYAYLYISFINICTPCSYMFTSFLVELRMNLLPHAFGTLLSLPVYIVMLHWSSCFGPSVLLYFCQDIFRSAQWTSSSRDFPKSWRIKWSFTLSPTHFVQCIYETVCTFRNA